MFAHLQGSSKCLNIWQIFAVFTYDDVYAELTVDMVFDA